MWKQYWPIYERLEAELSDLTFKIALTDAQLSTYSTTLAELLLRCGSEAENLAKALVVENNLAPANRLSRINFPSLGDLLCPTLKLHTKIVIVIWPFQELTQSNLSQTPFAAWSPTGNSSNPPWYTAYNDVKHDRAANKAKGTLGNVLTAVAGLFILNLWLRKADIESRGEWIELARRRIQSYSRFFDPSSFLLLGIGGTTKRLALTP
ncbi:MAG: hypothetical protein HY927_06135 [Elusimicrobia bacterium]|nr:hypothetical protein [Elusimicrobiota bacterium]